MFTHHVTMKLRSDSSAKLSRQFEKTILPILRRHKGFRDGVTIVAAERSTAIKDSYWETLEDVEAYQRTGYREVLRVLAELVTAHPQSSTFESSNSTFYQTND